MNLVCVVTEDVQVCPMSAIHLVSVWVLDHTDQVWVIDSDQWILPAHLQNNNRAPSSEMGLEPQAVQAFLLQQWSPLWEAV